MRKSRNRIGRALSPRQGRWQSRACAGLLLALACPLFAAPGGDIDTMAIGYYFCEWPGDAAGPVGRPEPDEDFAVVNASSYRAQGRMGSYLLTGDTLTLTSGPFEGKRYHRLSGGFLRKIGPDGKDSDLRCIRRKRNNSDAGLPVD
ncbi:MAG: hypothetical protein AB7F98_04425 [Novosphingobium sp.]